MAERYCISKEFPALVTCQPHVLFSDSFDLVYMLYSVQWGILSARPAAKVPDITDLMYHTVKNIIVTSPLGTGKSLSFFYSAVQSTQPAAHVPDCVYNCVQGPIPTPPACSRCT